MDNPDTRVRNSDFPWDDFDADWYLAHNFHSKRDDDHQITEKIRDFFGAAGVHDGHGLDVGSGTNLYPAMAMLPFCSQIDLWEFSAANLAWLERELPHYGGSWNAFWEVYRQRPAYASVVDPRATLASTAKAQQGSVFDLPKDTWDMGTMFFVACSLSTDVAEFYRAVRCFIRALKPGAPFAAAFMMKSDGYRVDGTWFPAVRIGAEEVRQSLTSIAYHETHDILTTNPLRPGYEGMLLVLGNRLT